MHCDTYGATFGPGTKLTVLEPGLKVTKPTVKVLQTSKSECYQRKRKKTLVCVATNFYPDHVTVTWKRNGNVVTEGVATDEMALRDGPGSLYSITSRLGVSAKDWFTKTSRFTCTVSFYNGSATEDVSDETQGEDEPRETKPTVKVLRHSKNECNQKKRKNILVCVATNLYVDNVRVTWRRNGDLVTKGVSTDKRALRDGLECLYSITSRLGVSTKDWFSKTSRFTCTVGFLYGSEMEYVSSETRGEEDSYMRSAQTVKLSYGILIAKSSLYGFFVMVLVWMFKGSTEK